MKTLIALMRRFRHCPEDNDPMILAEFDGFCAGLITCPEMISPSVWLAKVWGAGGPPEFDSAEELQAVLDPHQHGALQPRRRNADDPGEYFPVLDEDQQRGHHLGVLDDGFRRGDATAA